MKASIRHIIILCVSLLCSTKVVHAVSGTSLPIHMEKYIRNVYEDINFDKNNELSYDVFRKGLIGYINLRREGKLSDDKNVFTICDFSIASTQKRMWILDLKQKKVLLNTYVAHGQGTGDNYANKFSNLPESHQSSIGFYITADTYVGKHGNSMRLVGMDEGFNCAALDRAIVVHGAEYVSDDFIRTHNRLGRSWGCPAVSVEVSNAVINYTKGGTAFFIYYPSEKYLTTSYWLNKPVEFQSPAGTVTNEDETQNNFDQVEKVLKSDFNSLTD